MNAPYWEPNTQRQAETFVEQSMPRQLGKCCGQKDDDFRCTLFEGHSGSHEAWGIGHVLYHVWDNLKRIRSN